MKCDCRCLKSLCPWSLSATEQIHVHELLMSRQTTDALNPSNKRRTRRPSVVPYPLLLQSWCQISAGDGDTSFLDHSHARDAGPLWHFNGPKGRPTGNGIEYWVSDLFNYSHVVVVYCIVSVGLQGYSSCQLDFEFLTDSFRLMAVIPVSYGIWLYFPWSSHLLTTNLS